MFDWFFILFFTGATELFGGVTDLENCISEKLTKDVKALNQGAHVQIDLTGTVHAKKWRSWWGNESDKLYAELDRYEIEIELRLHDDEKWAFSNLSTAIAGESIFANFSTDKKMPIRQSFSELKICTSKPMSNVKVAWVNARL